MSEELWGTSIVKALTVLGIVVVLGSPCSLPVAAQEVMGIAAITGAGSSFAYPLISKWSKGYQNWVAGGADYPVPNSGLDDPPAGPKVDYEPVGSLARHDADRGRRRGFRRIRHASQVRGFAEIELIQFPVIIGGVVTVVSVEGIRPGQIKFTGPLLADIFLGKIRNWSDPAIAAQNPDIKLPDAEIVVVHRSDGSGTTFNFTNYLSKVSAEWREKVGADLLVAWPMGVGAKRNRGVAEIIAQTKNAIGYLEFAQARESGLSYALIENLAGRFVKPDASSFRAAADHADWGQSSDFNLLLTDAQGQNAYPIAATVFVLMRRAASGARTRATLNFLEWSLDKGAKDAADLGYVPLPQAFFIKSNTTGLGA